MEILKRRMCVYIHCICKCKEKAGHLLQNTSKSTDQFITGIFGHMVNIKCILPVVYYCII